MNSTTRAAASPSRPAPAILWFYLAVFLAVMIGTVMMGDILVLRFVMCMLVYHAVAVSIRLARVQNEYARRLDALELQACRSPS